MMHFFCVKAIELLHRNKTKKLNQFTILYKGTATKNKNFYHLELETEKNNCVSVLK